MPKKQSDGLRRDLLALRVEMQQARRLAGFENLLNRNLIREDRLTTEEMYQIAFGDAGEIYWRAVLGRPLRPRLLAWYLARHLTFEAQSRPVPQQLLQEGVLKALREGIDGGSVAYKKPVTDELPATDESPASPEADFNQRNRKRYEPPQKWCDLLRITEPVAAVKWLAGVPMYQHWVPASLRALCDPARLGGAQVVPPEPATAASVEPAEVSAPAMNDRLAVWIFGQHGRSLSYDALLKEAVGAQLGAFRTGDFRAAYKKVYETKRGRRRATGWPLRSPYKERLSESLPK